MFISVTRLRLRSIWYLPLFAFQAGRSRKQAEASRGCLGARVRKSQGLAFWTLTFWQDAQCMHEFRAQPPHSKVMPKLAQWCDEAAVAHWAQVSEDFPDWKSASERLRTTGRLLRVLRPSAEQTLGVINVN
jgi:Domain of unknown function (DUF3291)